MISSAYITPHPPIIIPGIGKPDDLKLVSKTIEAMEKLREDLEKINPDTILIISPHAPTDFSAFVVNSAPRLRGSLIDFGLDQDFDFENNLNLVKKIAAAGNRENIPVHFHESFLDHGALVPLYYLTENIKPKIVHLSFSLLNFKSHYRYGEIIGSVCGEEKNRIAIVASGDLSHRLTASAPAGYSSLGKKFDEKLMEMLAKKDISGILNLDKNFIDEAGECGLRSVIILLGILKDKYNFCCLNYEGPFGVGYLVASLSC
ncbi:MAG: class III extradiol dioxygenase subunit B-like domain-containing protein [Candidatus Moranbacteria bacterium]|nr:class III extradiol dioxygenase subunit B-like domain-containing protein [Candidatus Moranbacteria bacterium]